MNTFEQCQECNGDDPRCPKCHGEGMFQTNVERCPVPEMKYGPEVWANPSGSTLIGESHFLNLGLAAADFQREVESQHDWISANSFSFRMLLIDFAERVLEHTSPTSDETKLKISNLEKEVKLTEEIVNDYCKLYEEQLSLNQNSKK